MKQCAKCKIDYEYLGELEGVRYYQCEGCRDIRKSFGGRPRAVKRDRLPNEMKLSTLVWLTLRNYVASREWTLGDIERATGVKHQILSAWLNQPSRTVNSATLDRLVLFFRIKCSPSLTGPWKNLRDISKRATSLDDV